MKIRQILLDAVVCGGRAPTSQEAKTFDQISLFLKITSRYRFEQPKKPICFAGSLPLENLGHCAELSASLVLMATVNMRKIRCGWSFPLKILGNWMDFFLDLRLCK